MDKSDTPIDERARELANVAIDTLEDVMRDGIKDSDRIKAAEAILDRGFGKAAQAIIQVPASQRQQAMLSALTDEQLVAIIEKKALPRALPSQSMIDVVSKPVLKGHGPATEIYADIPHEVHPLLA